MKYVYSFMALMLVVSIFLPGDLWAQEPRREVNVTAESMMSLADGTVTAEGEVVVRGEGVTVRADNLNYDPTANTLMLKGNVIMEEDGGGTFTGDVLALDLADLTGGISSGEIIIVPNGFRVRGEDIERIGPEEYSVRKGVITSCPGDCPDWSFTASRIQVRKEGYLEARHAAFRIVGVPIFYTPYLLYPVKTQRQTGLLFPELSFSEQTGLESRWPVFITMGPHADVTLSPRTFSRDGFGLDIDSRYRLDWGGGGQIKGFAMMGERPERWYIGAEHSMALTPDLWIRWRWYDAGETTAPALFGENFEDRYPGAVYRHATLEGDHGIFGYNFQSSSLLTDGTQARSDLPGTVLQRDKGVLKIGPGGRDLWRLGLEAEDTHFDNGESRTLMTPTVSVWIPGPWKMAGYIHGRGIIGTGGDGSIEDEAYLISLTEKVAMGSDGDWGEHRVDLNLAASAAQAAAFGGSVLRDSRDLIQERKILDARLNSTLILSGFRWDLTAGAWRDRELDLSINYGVTRVSYSGAFLEASRNRDADFGLVLPSVNIDQNLLKGWQVEAGYESESFGFKVGRDSAEGFPEMLRSEGYFSLAKFRVSGTAIYDIDEETVADETVEIEVPGRCWKVLIGQSRTPDRTDWSLQLELGL